MGDNCDDAIADNSSNIASQEWGSDLIADLLKAYDFKYVPFNPGASFRGIEESIVNYNDNTPQVVETPHEGLTVSIAHGYAKATGSPSVCILHDVVGTLNGAMSIFNAYVDRAPILMLGGNGPLRKSKRRPWIEWMHTALDQGDLVGKYTKWYDQPFYSDGVLESMIRGYNVAATEPQGPVYITLDHDVQENRLDEPVPIPDLEKLKPPTKIGPDRRAIEEAANLLVEADRPAILTDDVGTSSAAVEHLIELAETLGAPVVDSPKKHRFNFPNTHPLYHYYADTCRDADVILALDVRSVPYVLSNTSDGTPVEPSSDVTVIDVGTHDLELSSLIADYYTIREADLAVTANTELAIPDLTDAITDRLDDGRTELISKRTERAATKHDADRDRWASEAKEQWDETPISLPRLATEIWDVIRDEQWVLVNGTLRDWSHKVWEIDEFDEYIGGYSGGGGIGYGIGGAIGGALAYEDSDRIPINLQTDGDLMGYPNGLWVIGHYQLPMLTIMHNNQTYYNSTNHRMKLAAHRGRDDSYESALVGTGIWDPVPDYAELAESVGVNGYGPIEDPDAIADALREAWKDVQNGTPALVDIVCQSR